MSSSVQLTNENMKEWMIDEALPHTLKESDCPEVDTVGTGTDTD